MKRQKVVLFFAYEKFCDVKHLNDVNSKNFYLTIYSEIKYLQVFLTFSDYSSCIPVTIKKFSFYKSLYRKFLGVPSYLCDYGRPFDRSISLKWLKKANFMSERRSRASRDKRSCQHAVAEKHGKVPTVGRKCLKSTHSSTKSA